MELYVKENMGQFLASGEDDMNKEILACMEQIGVGCIQRFFA